MVAAGSVVALTALGADERGGENATTSTATSNSAVVPVARIKARDVRRCVDVGSGRSELGRVTPLAFMWRNWRRTHGGESVASVPMRV